MKKYKNYWIQHRQAKLENLLFEFVTERILDQFPHLFSVTLAVKVTRDLLSTFDDLDEIGYSDVDVSVVRLIAFWP